MITELKAILETLRKGARDLRQWKEHTATQRAQTMAYDVDYLLRGVQSEMASAETLLLHCINNHAGVTVAEQPERKFGHYFKDVRHLQGVDVYRILQLFQVTDPALQHAIKKLLVCGGRGAKDQETDLNEAIASITRALEMRKEDA